MSFELLVIRDSWFLNRSDKSDFDALTKVINKAYSKARYKFDIIKTPRIKDPTTFVEDFAINDKNRFHLFVLLGPEEGFDQLHQKDSYERNFDIPNRNLNESYACDIPGEYHDLLEFNSQSDLEINEIDHDFVLDDKILKRVLGTMGLKIHNSRDAKDVGTNELLLTCFTSFMRNTAPVLLDTVIYRYLLKEKYMASHKLLKDPTKKVILHADVVKEHKLVEYYSAKCGFVFSREILIEVNEEGHLKDNPFEDNILATKNFHISFIHKEIVI